MIKINRIKAISRTEINDYGFDYKLKKGLNLISSSTNTRGKSSVILAIYYCLGLEEIVGGKGYKTLTSVYKNTIVNEAGVALNVLQSDLWLEISNGTDIVTIYRSGKMENRHENLITVYYEEMDKIYNPKTYVEDMYIHAQRSTTSIKGFHTFLEKFIGLELPLVPANEGKEYKLYLQLLFSTMFIEQKRGWADILSAMPILGIRDAKKRVVEYILALETLSNEKKRALLRTRESLITSKWTYLVKDINNLCNREECRINSIPFNPKILDDKFLDTIQIYSIGKDTISIDEKLSILEDEYNKTKSITPKIVDNFEALQKELDITNQKIYEFEKEVNKQQSILANEKLCIKRLSNNLENINTDIRNNKDAFKLQKMGSKLQVSSYAGVCPVCHQHIEDTLLPSQNETPIMSIEENIHHLEAQKSMVQFALEAHKSNRNLVEENIQSLSARLFTLRRLAKTIRNDLFATDDDISETIVQKRIQIEFKIQNLVDLKKNIKQKLIELKKLSNDWKEYLDDKNRMPESNFTEKDSDKIKTLDKYFKNNLRAFNYQSITNFNTIKISTENYLPTSEGFDMKFDSSASDNIRAIWAYTLALLQTSIEKVGNHPQILLFDEPAQHRIVTQDVISLFNTITAIDGEKQVIMGITLSDGDIQNAVQQYNKEKIHIIDVGEHAFKLLP